MTNVDFICFFVVVCCALWAALALEYWRMRLEWRSRFIKLQEQEAAHHLARSKELAQMAREMYENYARVYAPKGKTEDLPS